MSNVANQIQTKDRKKLNQKKERIMLSACEACERRVNY